jgi:hypothetical protein
MFWSKRFHLLGTYDPPFPPTVIDCQQAKKALFACVEANPQKNPNLLEINRQKTNLPKTKIQQYHAQAQQLYKSTDSEGNNACDNQQRSNEQRQVFHKRRFRDG